MSSESFSLLALTPAYSSSLCIRPAGFLINISRHKNFGAVIFLIHYPPAHFFCHFWSKNFKTCWCCCYWCRRDSFVLNPMNAAAWHAGCFLNNSHRYLSDPCIECMLLKTVWTKWNENEENQRAVSSAFLDSVILKKERQREMSFCQQFSICSNFIQLNQAKISSGNCELADIIFRIFKEQNVSTLHLCKT